jgi:hypothetical protein
VALCHRFSEPVSLRGPFTNAAAKTAIALKGDRSGFASIVVAVRSVDGGHRSATPCRRSAVRRLLLTTAREDPDDSVAALLRAADAVGEGGHLHR